ncbi:MAG: uroporphyrinogen methyltransferase / synthase [Gaiellaceae bacterium]|nr:uroporphyrinogen methyltransferase / synthase [Gaiellaceae bacterium]
MRVIVTRPRAQAEELAEALRSAGFEPVLCPLIEIEPIDDGPIEVDGYDWVIVTSANGAAELGRRHAGAVLRIAAVGEATASALAEHGLEASFIPSVSSQEGLLAELPRPVGRALFVGAAGARRLIADKLPADFRAVYRTVELTPEAPTGDLVLLASPSAARAWVKVGRRLPAITIGPQTTEAARLAGLDVVAEAGTQDVAALVDSAAAWRASSRS